MVKKYFIMERFSSLKWFRQEGGFKKLSTANKKLKEMMTWEGERKFAIVKAENAVDAKWALREKELGVSKHFIKKVKIIKIVKKKN